MLPVIETGAASHAAKQFSYKAAACWLIHKVACGGGVCLV